jgi:hypothetical protein
LQRTPLPVGKLPQAIALRRFSVHEKADNLFATKSDISIFAQGRQDFCPPEDKRYANKRHPPTSLLARNVSRKAY